ncbi:hypothetical protein KBD61_02945 [Patescibacteria group bacterium]|nr:hypothetical protein [Patescibacteria group bacterium]MBP9709959.1 hypothetical protein [Patescibacteria group bacterium]
MRNLMALAFGLVLAACSSTVTGGSTQALDAAQEVDGNVVAPDSGSDTPDDKVVTADADDVEVTIVPDADTSVDAEVMEDDVIDVPVPDVPSVDAPSPDVVETSVPIISSFEIEPYGMPPSITIVPGMRTVFARFRGRSRGENATMRRLHVPIMGQSASVEDVGVASLEGETVRSHGRAFTTGPLNSELDVVFDEPMHFVRDEWKVFFITGVMAPIQARSSLPPGTFAAFSGAYVQMGLDAGEPSGYWGSSYAFSFNVDVTGDESLRRLYTPGTTTLGNYMVVRRSRPRFQRIPLMSRTLIVAEMPNVIYEWELGAESVGGDFSWKKLTFAVFAEGGISLNEVQLLRNGRAVPLADYEIVDGINRNLQGSLRLSGIFYVTIRWRTEETIESGVRNVYRLIAVPRGGSPGYTIRTTPLISNRTFPGTGWMTADSDSHGLTVEGRDIAGPCSIRMIDLSSTATVPVAFLWSDRSQIPHLSAPYPMGSNDWADESWLDDLTEPYVLYAP